MSTIETQQINIVLDKYVLILLLSNTKTVVYFLKALCMLANFVHTEKS